MNQDNCIQVQNASEILQPVFPNIVYHNVSSFGGFWHLHSKCKYAEFSTTRRIDMINPDSAVVCSRLYIPVSRNMAMESSMSPLSSTVCHNLFKWCNSVCTHGYDMYIYIYTQLHILCIWISHIYIYLHHLGIIHHILSQPSIPRWVWTSSQAMPSSRGPMRSCCRMVGPSSFGSVSWALAPLGSNRGAASRVGMR